MSNVNDLVDMILIKINQSWWLCNIVIYFYTTGSMAEKKVQASIHWFYNNVTIGTKRTEGWQLFFPWPHGDWFKILMNSKHLFVSKLKILRYFGHIRCAFHLFCVQSLETNCGFLPKYDSIKLSSWGKVLSYCGSIIINLTHVVETEHFWLLWPKKW